MTRIAQLFERTQAETAAPALIAYMTAGDPAPDRTARAGRGAGTRRRRPDRAGRAVFRSDRRRPGDPARRRSRAQGRHDACAKCSRSRARSARSSEIPLLLFTYLNPVLRYGLEKLARDAAAAGIDGCLLTDAQRRRGRRRTSDAMRAHGLDTVFLAAPTSTERRLELVAQYSSGFVYLVSRTGVTGEQQSLSTASRRWSKRMRAVTELPLAVGFGISTRGARRAKSAAWRTAWWWAAPSCA